MIVEPERSLETNIRNKVGQRHRLASKHRSPTSTHGEARSPLQRNDRADDIRFEKIFGGIHRHLWEKNGLTGTEKVNPKPGNAQK